MVEQVYFADSALRQALIPLRQRRLMRITDQAREQGGLLSQEDLAEILMCDVRTIRRGRITLYLLLSARKFYFKLEKYVYFSLNLLKSFINPCRNYE
jgi:ribosome-binding protein aMBF1 (putative translation factor)